MGTKTNPGKFDCFAAARPDEPMFTLLGRDADAADLVRDWARARMHRIRMGEKPPSDWPKITEALALADQMDAYRENVAINRVLDLARRNDPLTTDELREFRRLFPQKEFNKPYHHPDGARRKYPPNARAMLRSKRDGDVILRGGAHGKAQRL